MASETNCLSFFCACNGLRLFIYSLCVFVCGVSSAAFQDENTLTIDLAAPQNPVPNTQHWSTYSPDDVRCYCNLPVCVSTGYMCKSEGGGCFSEMVDVDQFRRFPAQYVRDVYKGRHGCLELLGDKNQRSECKNMPSGKSTSRNSIKYLLLCCFKDMCNHVDSPETQTMLNGTLLGATMNDSPSHTPISSLHESNMAASPGYNSNEVWFKAAIIAVPICGIVILFLLIFLAVKILKTDTLSTSSKLGEPYMHHNDRKSNRDHFDQVHHQSSASLKKVPLLIHHHHHHNDMISACTNHSADEPIKQTAVPLLFQNETGVSHSYDKKNEANAKLNIAHGHEYNLVHSKETNNSSPLLGLHKPTNITSSNNIYKCVSLGLQSTPTAVQASTPDKLYGKPALSAVINWGAPSPSSSPV